MINKSDIVLTNNEEFALLCDAKGAIKLNDSGNVNINNNSKNKSKKPYNKKYNNLIENNKINFWKPLENIIILSGFFKKR